MKNILGKYLRCTPALLAALWIGSPCSFGASPDLYPWIKNNVAPNTGMPLSYVVPKDKERVIYRDIGAGDSLTSIIERMITNQGISIYDGALWQIVLTMHGEQEDLDCASIPIKYYWQGNLFGMKNIRAGFPGQPFVYDPEHPYAVSSHLRERGKRGFIFRILNAYGRYNTHDPLDGKRRFTGFPNWPTIHWEDWKPIAGENAWVTMAALHLYHKKYYDENRKLYTQHMSEEMGLAMELIRAALILQAENGGIRMSPIGTHYSLDGVPYDKSLMEIINYLDRKKMDNTIDSSQKSHSVQIGDRMYPVNTCWHYLEISTENNLSWYATFRMIYQITKNKRYKQAMLDIERFFKSMWDDKEHYLYQGAHYKNGEWVANKEHFATDVQTWAIAVLGPRKIDQWFGEGAAMKLWQTTKQYAGYYDTQGKIRGVGFTKNDHCLSVEWTGGALLATHYLEKYYKRTHPDWSEEVRTDYRSMRSGVNAYLYTIDGKQAYSYSSRRLWIPFGWFSHAPQVVSMASTCWIYFVDQKINPFLLNQRSRKK